MKKLMVLAAMLAMMLAMAAPAFAQDVVAIDEGDDVEFNAGAQNIIGSVGDITNTQSGTAVAVADNDSAAAASVDQSQEVTISQSNEFGNGFFFGHHHWVFFF